MVRRKPYTTQRSDSANEQFVRRIPAAIKPRLIGKTLVVPLGGVETARQVVTQSTQALRFSLGTADPKVAEVRRANALSYILTLFDAIEKDRRVTLSHPQLLALAGGLYRGWVADPANDGNLTIDTVTGEIYSGPIMGDPENDAMVLEQKAEELEVMLEGEQLDEIATFYGLLTDTMLARHGIANLSDQSRETLLRIMADLHAKALRQAAKRWRGDYSADLRLASLPTWEDAKTFTPVHLSELVDDWWTEAKNAGISVSTYDLYKRAFTALAAYVGHDDASKITASTIVDFKNMLAREVSEKTGKKLSPKTIRGSYLSGLQTVFKWAVANKKLPSNPAEGISVKTGKVVKVRGRDFTKEEATAILKSCLALGTPRFLTGLVQKWAPWLCAYTGARIGEIVQLRKEDVTYDASLDSWVIRITPEAHTVKTKEFRLVPVHPHLIELGFVEECLKSDLNADHDYIFMPADKGDEVRGQWRSKKNRVAEFVRLTVKDPNVAPNHGWRHTFKSIGFEVGIQEKVLDELCGHAPASIGRGYGSVTLKTKVEAIRAFPRWLVADEQRTEMADG